ncbi:hypothetical protein LY76DRAFT_176507 [Colletotrichum caudatum]|nr:hypothetical protein LY76DRAFT_176507 [Colletotrichum caudatum]
MSWIRPLCHWSLSAYTHLMVVDPRQCASCKRKGTLPVPALPAGPRTTLLVCGHLLRVLFFSFLFSLKLSPDDDAPRPS